ncbi:MAG: hypothetical protein HKN70_06460 [Gammaproteobacteria bacterium]|nr:hypothetical protein [Gammaproteobacteria bacterium]
MRKFALLSTALLLFSILVISFVSLSENTASNAPAQPSDQNSVPVVTTPNAVVGLRLDTRLANLPQSAPRPAEPQANAISWVRDPDRQRALLFLTGALVLGLFTGAALRRRPAAQPADREFASLSLPDLGSSSGDTDALIAETAAQHAARTNELEEEITALRDSIQSHEIVQDDNQQRLSEHQATIEELRQELRHTDDLSVSMQRAQQQEKLLAAELDERDDIIDNLHKDIASWQEKLDIRSAEFEELDKQHEHVVQQEQTLADELAEREQTINNLKSDIDNWREEWAARTKHIEELDRQLSTLTADLEKARDDETAAQNAVEELQQAHTALLAEIDVLTPNVALAEDLRQQLEELDKRYDIAMSDKQALEEALDDAVTHAQKIPELETHLDAAREKISEQSTALAETQAQIEELQASFDEVQKQKARSDEQFVQLNCAHSEQSAALNEQMHLLVDAQSAGERQQREIDELQAALDTAQAEAEAHNADALELKKLLNEANADLERKQQEYADTQTELEQQKSEKEELVNHKLVLEEQLSELDTELAAARNNNTELDDRVALLRNDLDQMTGKIHDKNSGISALKNELVDSQKLLDEKECEISELAKQLDEKRDTIAEMNEKIDAANATEARLSSWDNSLQTYKHDLTTKNRLIDDLRDELTLATHTGTLLKAQIRNLDEQLETLFDVQTEAARLNEVNSQLNVDLQKQNEIIENLGAQSQQHDENIDCFDEELQALQREHSQWQQHMEKSALAVRGLQDELADIHTILARLDELMEDELDHEHYSTWTNIADGGSIVDRLVTITGHAKFLRDSLRAATAENEVLLSSQDEMVKLQEHVQLLQQALGDHQYDLQQEITARKQQEQKCQNYRETIVTLETQIADRQSRIDTLTKSTDASEELVDTLRQELQTARVQLDEANANLRSQDQEISQLNGQITAVEAKQQEQTELLKTRTRSIKQHYEQQRHGLIKRYQSTSDQLRRALSGLQETHQELQRKLQEKDARLNKLQQAAEPLPVLTTEYAHGKPADNVPVLSARANRITRQPDKSTADKAPPAVDIPVLRDTVGKDE